MSWLKTLTDRSNSRAARTKRRDTLHRAMQMETLESRRVLAATWSLSSGNLVINADSNGTQALVTDTAPLQPNGILVVTAQSSGVNWSVGIAKPSVQSIRFNGSEANDTFSNATLITSKIYGNGGNDVLTGGSGVDHIWGQVGNDVLNGNGGADYLYGGPNDDNIFGGSAGDFIYGQDGNDHLFGGAGNDFLSGGTGRDGIYGGLGVDTANGGTGADRLLYHDSDTMNLVQDYSALEDVHVHFGNAPQVVKQFYGTTSTFAAGTWVEADVLKVDVALDLMARRTGNNVLLRDVDGSELNFYRHGTVTNVGPGIYTAYNSGGDMYFSNSIFASENNAVQTVVHEVAHNWDTASEVNQRLPEQGNSIIGGFRANSGWTPGSFMAITHPSFMLSKDFQWSHLANAQFASDYGRTNPMEDFATAMEAYFMDYDGRPYDDGPGAVAIPGKIASINSLLDQLANVSPMAIASAASGSSKSALAMNGSSERAAPPTKIVVTTGMPAHSAAAKDRRSMASDSTVVPSKQVKVQLPQIANVAAVDKLIAQFGSPKDRQFADDFNDLLPDFSRP